MSRQHDRSPDTPQGSYQCSPARKAAHPSPANPQEPVEPNRSVPSFSLGCHSSRPARRTSRTAFFEDAPDPADPLLGFAPYLHTAPRRNSITPERQRAFIAALAASGIVTQAARTIGASLEALYKLRALPGAEGFAAAWEGAIDRGLRRLEDCALERAILGEQRPVVSGGQWLGTWTRYDTPLMLFMLRQRLPERYDGRRMDQRHPQPGDPLYERVREAVLAEDGANAQAVRASIDAKLAALRTQVHARQMPGQVPVAPTNKGGPAFRSQSEDQAGGE